VYSWTSVGSQLPNVSAEVGGAVKGGIEHEIAVVRYWVYVKGSDKQTTSRRGQQTSPKVREDISRTAKIRS